MQPRSVMLEDPYVGDWDFVVRNTPAGNAEGILNIEREGTLYRANLISDAGETSIEKLYIENEKLKGHFKYKGFKVNVKGQFEGNSFEGKLGVTLASFPVSAVKLAD